MLSASITDRIMEEISSVCLKNHFGMIIFEFGREIIAGLGKKQENNIIARVGNKFFGKSQGVVIFSPLDMNSKKVGANKVVRNKINGFCVKWHCFTILILVIWARRAQVSLPCFDDIIIPRKFFIKRVFRFSPLFFCV